MPDHTKEQVQALLLTDISMVQTRASLSVLAYTVACILLRLCAYHMSSTYLFSSPVHTAVATCTYDI